jgi:cell division protein FtsB
MDERNDMDAKELTEKYWKQKAEIAELQKTVSYLEQVVEKLELKINDMDYDVRMLQRGK